MEDLLSPDRLLALLASARDWFVANVLVVDNLLQALIVGVTFVASRHFGARLGGWLGRLQTPYDHLAAALSVGAQMARPLLWLFFLWAAILLAVGAHWSKHRVLNIAISLLPPGSSFGSSLPLPWSPYGRA